MSVHSTPPIIRRKSRKIWVGNVPASGDAPIAVQSTTNTETCDVAATVAQIRRLEDAGAGIVRVSVPDMDAAEAFDKIKQQVNVPLVADTHFDYRIALRVAELGVGCLRINPGNISHEDRVKAVIDAAREYNIPIRTGVNTGSLGKDLQKEYGESTPEALPESAMRHVDHLDKLDFQNFKVSVKASDVFVTVAAYHLLARQIEQPLHLGTTEAGGLCFGTAKSVVGPGMLLAEGIDDTIRISLVANPVEEIKVGFGILKSLHLRSRSINFVVCPSCSRQNFDVVKTMNELEGRLEDLLIPMDVVVIGCVVNGSGETKEAHVGLTGGTPNLVYIDGKPSQKLTNDNLVDELERLIRQKTAEKAEADASLTARGWPVQGPYMSKLLQTIRGMNGILPEQTPAWRYLECTFAGLLDSYGYNEICLPILEFTKLFVRGIGEGTDTVDKEMYTFLDHNGESLTMCPGGTAGCVRAVLEHGLSGGGQMQKLWHTGPMFRYEKSQRGRYRQFHQIGVEVFNLPGPDIDAELIILT